MKRLWSLMLVAAMGMFGGLSATAAPIHVTYLWHMHQPIYWPYETVNDTINNGRYTFDLGGVFGSRTGPYTTWPKDAVEQGHNRSGLEHSGVQVSFSGALAENLSNLWGDPGSNGWDDSYDWGINGLRTSLNNPRLDVVMFPYHHSLMPLTTPESRRMQIRLFKEIFPEVFDTSSYSKGMFPAECAFANWIIPDLVAEGIEWVLVDNVHFDRACQNYPWNSGGNLYRPNPADQVNPDPATIGSSWEQLQNVWAPTPVSVPWGYQPHYVQYINPESTLANPDVTKIVAVPAARYDGNENARGGYGAYKPENVWSSKVGLNDDPDHPMIIVAHSDGDNYGMLNSDVYHAQHGFFLDMCQNNSDFDNTTVSDYLQLYPVDQNDIIHIEPGSWSGADNGDPEFKKWMADPNVNDPTVNPDRFSWSVLMAAHNRVITADSLENSYSMNDVQWGIGSDTAKAWHYYLNAEASDYWYWDSDWQNGWNGHVTRGCNLAVAEADKVIARHPGSDTVGPSIFEPQREPYNPGGFEWNETTPQPSDFEVFTYIYDVSGLQSVTLKWRIDNDGFNPISSIQNEIYAGGPEVGAWNSIAMTGSFDPSSSGPNNVVPSPTHRAQTYKAMITGQSDVLIDYYVEAVDNNGNIRKSNIKHVVVGTAGGNPVFTYAPSVPEDCGTVTLTYDPAGRPLDGISPVKVQLDWQPSVSPPVAPDMIQTNGTWVYTAEIPDGETNLVLYFHNGGGTVDDNGGANWSVPISACSTGPAAVVSFDPPVPDGCGNVTVSYSKNYGPLKNATNILIHIGRNGWQDVIQPDPVMTGSATGTWTYVYTVPEGSTIINAAFTDGEGNWDNNQSADYHVNVTNCAADPVPAGIVITNPAADTVTVTNLPSYNVQGTAGTNLTGHLQWTNELNGQKGFLPVSTYWSIGSAGLSDGTNIIAVYGSNVVVSTSVLAEDDASDAVYDPAWDTGDDGGSGWGGGWILNASSNAGHFRASLPGNANISIGSPAWGLWANNGGVADAVRPFAAGLEEGRTFRMKLDNNFVENGGVVGIGMQNSTGDNLMEFYFVGGSSFYKIQDGNGERDTAQGWTGDGLQLTFTPRGAEGYAFSYGATTVTGLLISATDQTVRQVRVFNAFAGSGDDFNVYANDLRIETQSSSSSITGDVVTIIREPTMQDGIPVWWWQKYGLGPTNRADGNVDNDIADNWTEFVADTDPTDDASCFTNLIHDAHGSDVLNLMINGPTTNSRLYDVWYTPDLSGSGWIPMNMNILGKNDGGPVTLVLTNSGSIRFLRTGVKIP